MKTVMVTGGAGFIGSNFVKMMVAQDVEVINIDKLTYAGNLTSLADLQGNKLHIFVQGSINDQKLVAELLREYKPAAIINFAAESHVDRSIDGPKEFMETNIMGTFSLLEETKNYWQQLSESKQHLFRLLHVSTDEVYGSLGEEGYFTEKTPYAPNSPYSASKAASDHLVRAYHHTYGLPTLTTNCSNNYGAYQFPEKLIPLMIHNALTGKKLPIYGDGKNIRDWLFVLDHCQAIDTILKKGQVGETYNIGGNNEKTNVEVVYTICDLLDELKPRQDGRTYREQIQFVQDRLGHDRRYAIDAAKLQMELGWKPIETFESGMCKTVKWYLENQEWCQRVCDGSYRGVSVNLI